MTNERTNMPMRVSIEALKAAKIAASLKELSVIDYVSAIVLETANRDIAAWRAQGPKPKKGSV